MILQFMGPIHGDFSFIRKNYSPTPDWLILIGSIGAWPDPNIVDNATRKYGAGEFSKLYYEHTQFPIQTLFISGPHEDHNWLHRRTLNGNLDILPNLTYLKNGYKTTIGNTLNTVSIIGVGKTYSKKHNKNNKPNTRYYTEKDVQTACANGPTDILISHTGLFNEQYGNYKCAAKGLKQIIYATRPALFVHSGFNCFKEYLFLDTKCFSLKKYQSLTLDWNNNLFNVLNIS